MTDISERLQAARLGMTIGIDALLLEAADEIKWLQTLHILAAARAEVAQIEVERLQELLRGTGANRYWEGRWRDEAKENDLLLAVIEKLNTEIERLRATVPQRGPTVLSSAGSSQGRVIPGTNIPDADTPSY